mmetsp:Transcript_55923/g.162006  ORF Transcript_55923/g.162006 Transcript_55923/m.162006 type:complete len:200 (-) Transcript_55923:956-1555(-)
MSWMATPASTSPIRDRSVSKIGRRARACHRRCRRRPHRTSAPRPWAPKEPGSSPPARPRRFRSMPSPGCRPRSRCCCESATDNPMSSQMPYRRPCTGARAVPRLEGCSRTRRRGRTHNLLVLGYYRRQAARNPRQGQRSTPGTTGSPPPAVLPGSRRSASRSCGRVASGGNTRGCEAVRLPRPCRSSPENGSGRPRPNS